MEKSERIPDEFNESEQFLDSKQLLLNMIEAAERDILFHEEVTHLKEIIRGLNINEWGILFAGFVTEHGLMQVEDEETHTLYVHVHVGEIHD